MAGRELGADRMRAASDFLSSPEAEELGLDMSFAVRVPSDPEAPRSRLWARNGEPPRPSPPSGPIDNSARAVGADLHGTELVVLSACQTGLGDIKTGEGVYGLRRAFLHAGARTLVTSLFEVPDTETRQLMQRFYAGIAAGRGKLVALHAAQVGLMEERRKSHAAAHPFFWASFVLVGNPD